MNKKLTFIDAYSALIAMNVRLQRTTVKGEFQVRRCGSKPGEGYFTNDLQDAFDTGKVMATEAIAAKHRVPGHPVSVLREQVTGAVESGKAEAITEQRETFVQYLRRYSVDLRQSDSESFTADDYDMTAKRIEELEGQLFATNLALIRILNGNGNHAAAGEIFKASERVLADKFQHLN